MYQVSKWQEKIRQPNKFLDNNKQRLALVFQVMIARRHYQGSKAAETCRKAHAYIFPNLQWLACK